MIPCSFALGSIRATVSSMIWPMSVGTWCWTYFPASIFATSRRSLISSSKESILFIPLFTKSCCFSSRGPANPSKRTLLSCLMETRGLRSSWATILTKSDFISSSCLNAVISSRTVTVPATALLGPRAGAEMARMALAPTLISCDTDSSSGDSPLKICLRVSISDSS